MGALLAECVAYMNERFLSYMEQDIKVILTRFPWKEYTDEQ